MAKERTNSPVRISEKALRYAKVAASYKGMTVSDYVSDALLRITIKDIKEDHAGMIDKNDS